MDAETASHDMSLMNSLVPSVVKSLMPSQPTLKWMASAAETMGATAKEAAIFAEETAPFALGAMEMLAPLVLLVPKEEHLVSAAAEVRRYNEVMTQSTKFGDPHVLLGVEDNFKDAIAYYRQAIQDGKNYVMPYT